DHIGGLIGETHTAPEHAGNPLCVADTKVMQYSLIAADRIDGDRSGPLVKPIFIRDSGQRQWISETYFCRRYQQHNDHKYDQLTIHMNSPKTLTHSLPPRP